MNETKLKGSVYWRASEKAFDTPHYPDLRSWCLCISKTARIRRDPLYRVQFMGLLGPQKSKHTLENDSNQK